jgi:hypothetical protein
MTIQIGRRGIGNRGGSGSSSISGVSSVDFGEGSMTASTIITGVTGISSVSVVLVQLRLEGTVDHSVTDMLIDPVRVSVENIVTGVGFTITASMDNARANGTYKFNWVLY